VRGRHARTFSGRTFSGRTYAGRVNLGRTYDGREDRVPARPVRDHVPSGTAAAVLAIS
jgi:hypothetical protein